MLHLVGLIWNYIYDAQIYECQPLYIVLCVTVRSATCHYVTLCASNETVAESLRKWRRFVTCTSKCYQNYEINEDVMGETRNDI